ncbi:MAG: type 1 glutamine amidotransferase [PVC group bacterium]|nr:type 1 glutamine amidotransferase [PVC group bacterium]
MIAIVQHIAIEGLGELEALLKRSGYEVGIIKCFNNEIFPDDLGNIEAVITLGGPMNVYEEQRYPFLKEEQKFLKKVMRYQIPLLGICLGAQLIAKACGAQVTKASQPEIGWYPVRLTEEGKYDSFFAHIGKKIDVFQWHEDTFELPEDAVLLATSDRCINQAFRIGSNVYGLQFHFEVTDQEIKEWSGCYLDSFDPQTRTRTQKMLTQYEKIKSEVAHYKILFVYNFLKVIKEVVRV